MKTHTLVFRQTDRRNFEAIRAGLKTVETRAATPRYQKVAVGDQLVVKCGSDRITKPVVAVERFASVAALLKAVPSATVMPFAATPAEVRREYDSYPGYQQKIAAYGLVAWWLGESI